jgi:hypothetical protein
LISSHRAACTLRTATNVSWSLCSLCSDPFEICEFLPRLLRLRRWANRLRGRGCSSRRRAILLQRVWQRARVRTTGGMVLLLLLLLLLLRVRLCCCRVTWRGRSTCSGAKRGRVGAHADCGKRR